jgi:hypothetical protein
MLAAVVEKVIVLIIKHQVVVIHMLLLEILEILQQDLAVRRAVRAMVL